MGWTPANIRRQCNMIRLWHRIASMHASRIPNPIFQWDLTLSEKYWKTSYNELKSVMEKCELLELLNNNYTNGLSLKFIANYSELLLRQEHHEKWKLDIMNMPKLRTFKCLETNFETQQYITTNMTRQQSSTLARMRCGTFPLELVVSRQIDVFVKFVLTMYPLRTKNIF
ncbi:unnamed protein product [Mytilus coruscus]|uniref:Uncharacterized protein n=1 Tax=Mytilus coruscus TaxID=42192 RepID=A0A6J8A8F8_MYTCO|nr:unnamed protein product [Mytilus coruscus]